MRIRIFGHGPLAEPIARLAERAGHTVRRCDEAPVPPDNDELLDLVILAGSKRGVEADLENISNETLQNLIVVDAMTPTRNELESASPDVAESIGAESAWIATVLPEPRIVRAFASVPVQAFTDLLHGTSSGASARLAVPLAGDDRDAKALVATFMREIGVEPFDLGALSSAEVLDPGGPLWGKALSQLEMLETVGWLSGDG